MDSTACWIKHANASSKEVFQGRHSRHCSECMSAHSTLRKGSKGFGGDNAQVYLKQQGHMPTGTEPVNPVQSRSKVGLHC